MIPRHSVLGRQITKRLATIDQIAYTLWKAEGVSARCRRYIDAYSNLFKFAGRNDL